jgi:GAF domain-containing protein
MTENVNWSDDLGANAWSVAENLARNLHFPSQELQSTLDAIIRTATDMVEAADYAGLIVIEQSKLIPKATLGRPPEELDLLQQRMGSGPCFEAAASQQVISIHDTTSEPRWTRFNAIAAQYGVLSVLCVPLWVTTETLGTLSVYSRTRGAFAPEQVRLVQLLAAHAALALANAQQASQLRTAFLTRDVIGQAKGILMERHKISATTAFEMLSKASQAANQKVSELALQLTETGELGGGI